LAIQSGKLILEIFPLGFGSFKKSAAFAEIVFGLFRFVPFVFKSLDLPFCSSTPPLGSPVSL